MAHPLLLVLALAVGGCDGAASDPSPAYGIQIDAGSSGTRLYIYEWAARESEVDLGHDPTPFSHSTSKPTPNQVAFSIRVTPGLSSFGTDAALTPSMAGPSLAPLFAFASSTLSTEGCDLACQATVPVFLGATAGMRILNVAKSEEIMGSVQGFIATSSGFRFDDVSWARIISGEEEGGYGWLAVNWLLGSWQDRATAATTVGALDLGGASTQMSFLPAESILASYFNVNVNDEATGIYTHSYLYYGQDQALEQQAAALVATGGVLSPTRPLNSSSSMFCFARSQRPTTRSTLASRWVQSTRRPISWILRSHCVRCGLRGYPDR